jgi:para-aminobenzoate synthetase component 1
MPRVQPPPVIQFDSSLPGAAGCRWTRSPIVTDRLLSDDDPASNTVRLRTRAGEVLGEWPDPVAALGWLGSPAAAVPGYEWLGYLSYDLGRCFEQIPDRATDDLGLPRLLFAHRPVDGLPLDPSSATGGLAADRTPVRSSFSRAAYLAAVGRAIDYIRAGDIFQVNLSQRFTAPMTLPPRAVYDRLTRAAPAAYGALLHFGDHALICNSPELFLRVAPQPDGTRTATTRPIKGTRPRAPGMDAALRDSAKDQAELNMIVDLERNDLGRVCEIGTVCVTQPRTIEAHPTVYHGVATVEGTLRSDVTLVDLLRATFPGGSITGAPKIRAMQIIEELEPTRRGPYCGAIGYVSADGSMEFNIAIRSMIVKAGQVHIPVGGGIVADSDPADEYDETLVKARAMFAALGIDVNDLREG